MLGAGGPSGRLCVAEAVRRGMSVRAVVRDPAKYAAAFPAGVEVVPGDVTAPQSLDPAVRGARNVVFAAAAASFFAGTCCWLRVVLCCVVLCCVVLCCVVCCVVCCVLCVVLCCVLCVLWYCGVLWGVVVVCCGVVCGGEIIFIYTPPCVSLGLFIFWLISFVMDCISLVLSHILSCVLSHNWICQIHILQDPCCSPSNPLA